MEHKVKQETIEKYFNSLNNLREILRYTNRISLEEFSIKNNLSKNLSKVLQKGGIIKCIKKGRFSEWEWTTIEPTRQMALKTIQMLGKENPPRESKSKRGGKRVGAGRKPKERTTTDQTSYDVKNNTKCEVKKENQEVKKEIVLTPMYKERSHKFSFLWGLISYEKQ